MSGALKTIANPAARLRLTAPIAAMILCAASPTALSRDRAEPHPVRAPITGPYNPDFVIDGVALGGSIDPNGATYRVYSCRPSEDFSGLTRCLPNPRTQSGKFGPYTSRVTILHSAANKVVFITQSLIPAFFGAGDVDQEIQRLSQQFGQAARILNADFRPGVPHAILAVWGDVTLTPLDEPTMDALRRGEQIHVGLVTDFLGDAYRSARAGLHVYSLSGGPGYLWSADFDDTGKGSLRRTAVDASAFTASAPSSTAQANAASPPSIAPSSTAQTNAASLPSIAPSSTAQPNAASPPSIAPSSTAQPNAASPPSIAAPLAPSPEEAARRERERANHLEKAVAAAKRQLDDAAQFIKEDPHNPKLLDYVDRVAALNVAVGQNDPDEIEREMANLSAALANDKDYQQFAVALAKRRNEAAAQHLSDAIQLARNQHDFLVDHVSRNPLGPEVATLMPLIKQIGPALEKSSLDQLQPLTDQIGNAIREANLDEEFRAAEAARANQAAQTPAAAKVGEPSSTTLPTTEKNRFLIEGNLADVLVLYNAGTKAPHVALNLRGEFVFADDRANVCLFRRDPESVALTVRAALAPYHLKPITGLDQPCDPQRLDAYDIVAMQRGAFLKTAPDDALLLIKQIEMGGMRQFARVSAAELAERAASERAAIEQIKADVTAGARNGYGVILLKAELAKSLHGRIREERSARAAHPQERRQAEFRYARHARTRSQVGRRCFRRRAKSGMWCDLRIRLRPQDAVRRVDPRQYPV